MSGEDDSILFLQDLVQSHLLHPVIFLFCSVLVFGRATLLYMLKSYLCMQCLYICVCIDCTYEFTSLPLDMCVWVCTYSWCKIYFLQWIIRKWFFSPLGKPLFSKPRKVSLLCKMQRRELRQSDRGAMAGKTARASAPFLSTFPLKSHLVRRGLTVCGHFRAPPAQGKEVLASSSA